MVMIQHVARHREINSQCNILYIKTENISAVEAVKCPLIRDKNLYPESEPQIVAALARI